MYTVEQSYMQYIFYLCIKIFLTKITGSGGVDGMLFCRSCFTYCTAQNGVTNDKQLVYGLPLIPGPDVTVSVHM